MSAQRRSVGEAIHDARVALRDAAYGAVPEILAGAEDWPAAQAEIAVVIKARALARRDPVAASAYLTSVEDIPTSPAGRFAFALALGAACAAVRDLDGASARLAEARILAPVVADGGATLAAHELSLAVARRAASVDAALVARAIAHPEPAVVAAAYADRSRLHALNGRTVEALGDLRRALDVATAAGAPDRGLVAEIVAELTQLGFETADEDAVAAARTAAERFAWTDDLAVARFRTVRALGWDAFMRGKIGAAQWAFRDAAGLAPSPAWRAMAHLDRSYAARIAGNEPWALDELGKAERLAREIVWEQVDESEREVLVVLSLLLAQTDAMRAQQFAARSSRMAAARTGSAIRAADRLAAAAAQYARGRIDATLGRRDAAEDALRDAYDVFAGASYHYRAALAASALAELTGGARWRDRARDHTRRYPDCPLSAIVERERAGDEAMPAGLTMLQDRIARALVAGAEPAELSQRFSRSRYTIEREIAAVYAAFGVRTARALAVEARRRRLA